MGKLGGGGETGCSRTMHMRFTTPSTRKSIKAVAIADFFLLFFFPAHSPAWRVPMIRYEAKTDTKGIQRRPHILAWILHHHDPAPKQRKLKITITTTDRRSTQKPDIFRIPSVFAFCPLEMWFR